jgi:hypothetical protein
MFNVTPATTLAEETGQKLNGRSPEFVPLSIMMASKKMQIYRGGRGGNPLIAKNFLRDLRGGKALFATSSIIACSR